MTDATVLIGAWQYVRLFSEDHTVRTQWHREVRHLRVLIASIEIVLSVLLIPINRSCLLHRFVKNECQRLSTSLRDGDIDPCFRAHTFPTNHRG